MTIHRDAVSSTCVRRSSYDDRLEVIEITYPSGATYGYPVPPPVYSAYLRAPSKGQFVNYVIKPNFPAMSKT